MLLEQWIEKVRGILTHRGEPRIVLKPEHFNSKTSGTYNAQRELKGAGRVIISECGHDPKGRMQHFGYNGDYPMTEEEYNAHCQSNDGAHPSQD